MPKPKIVKLKTTKKKPSTRLSLAGKLQVRKRIKKEVARLKRIFHKTGKSGVGRI